MQNIVKITSYLGLAIRAGKTIFGVDALVEKQRRRRVIIMCPSTGENTAKQVRAYALKTQSPLVVLEGVTIEEILKKNCKVITVTDQNLAKAILANASIGE